MNQIFKKSFSKFSCPSSLKKMDQNEIALMLSNNAIQNWKHSNNAIQKEYQFKDFKQAFSFMTQVGIIADEMDHHPEWFNVYNTVKINLNTHDAPGLTMKDFYLASAIDYIYLKMKSNNFHIENLSDTSYLIKHRSDIQNNFNNLKN